MIRYKGYRAFSVRHVSTGDDFIESSEIIFSVPFLAIKETLVALANYPIISERSIWSFRHLKHFSLYTGDDFIDSHGIIF